MTAALGLSLYAHAVIGKARGVVKIYGGRGGTEGPMAELETAVTRYDKPYDDGSGESPEQLIQNSDVVLK